MTTGLWPVSFVQRSTAASCASLEPGVGARKTQIFLSFRNFVA